jgi:hypothetical protein
MLCWHATFLCPNRLAVVDEVGTSGYPSKLKRPTTVWWVVLCPLVASSPSSISQIPTRRAMHFALNLFPTAISSLSIRAHHTMYTTAHAYKCQKALLVSCFGVAEIVGVLSFFDVFMQRDIATCTPRQENLNRCDVRFTNEGTHRIELVCSRI